MTTKIIDERSPKEDIVTHFIDERKPKRYYRDAYKGEVFYEPDWIVEKGIRLDMEVGSKSAGGTAQSKVTCICTFPLQFEVILRDC